MKIHLYDFHSLFDNVNFNKSMLQIFYQDILKLLTLVKMGKDVRCLSFKGFYVLVT